MKRNQGLHHIACTYSIIAMDKTSGEMGGAVQSHFFSVGPAVLWAEAGSGTVATQSVVNRQYGPDGIALLRKGISADQVLHQLITNDPGREYRQTAVLDATGAAAVHTGSSCIREAGHRSNICYSVQANMMLKDTVWTAMEEAFLSHKGTLAQRMLASLCAAEQEGGDIRGKQSAAMKVVRIEGTGDVAKDNILDLRVDDNPDPLKELSRLLSLYEGYAKLELGDQSMGNDRSSEAMEHYRQAKELLGSNPEALYWHGIALLNSGEISGGMKILEPLFSAAPNWLELTLRLPESGLVTFSKKVLESLQELTDRDISKKQ